MVALFLYRCIAYITVIFIASVPFYLLCQFLKSKADIVEVTVMEVLERKSQLDVFRLVQSQFLMDLLYSRNTETVRFITCTCSKPTPCTTLNIVYNIVYYSITEVKFN